ncbi:3-oxoacyl-ACP synthase [Flavobacterium dauae]|uniref:3-oxoacyl-ACP synthase n=1 Tax=Flavobacterium dauae TaxID=1563479 RepID=UPI00101B3B31|nr:3-oxoacyl-ACP synthase [Flavobacterium dauae]WLD23834.1 3-oxoacyl-ACP synthase [Flavobacterium dauae]
MYAINKFINISQNVVCENGKSIFHNQEDTFAAFMKNVYKNLNISYPKFYKMDDLCKLAFIASELLLQNETEKDIALLFSNNEASLDTDLKHQQSIQNPENYYPSPAIFVYTLSNITIGEVSIRHKLKSESAFFIANEYQTNYMHKYTEHLLQTNKATKVLCGWVHCLNGAYKACFYLVESNGNLEHTIHNINNITK